MITKQIDMLSTVGDRTSSDNMGQS